jgi:hypothetical protein
VQGAIRNSKSLPEIVVQRQLITKMRSVLGVSRHQRQAPLPHGGFVCGPKASRFDPKIVCVIALT